MIGFIDVPNLADILDIRASTVRGLLDEGSDLLPKPIMLGTLPHWPLVAIRQWCEAGTPSGWEYDHEEYGRLAWESYSKANGFDSEDVDLLYLNQRRMALPKN